MKTTVFLRHVLCRLLAVVVAAALLVPDDAAAQTAAKKVFGSMAGAAALMPASQSLISTHLARLRHEGLVTFRKIGQNSFYELSDDRVRHVIDALGEVFCDGLRGHIR